MSSLTGNQIQNTYQGLLKLADSSTGITQSLQALQDGLGNDTGMKIGTDTIEIPSLPNTQYLKAAFGGNGYNIVAGAAITSGFQNIILATPFYDKGIDIYTAITMNVVTATSSSDTLEVGLYSTQMINPNGLYPHEAIATGITFSLTGTGTQTYVFPSDVSFSGYGGGIYWVVYKISNGGVQPTVRFGAGTTGSGFLFPGAPQVYGVAQQFNNSFSASPFRTAGSYFAFSGQTTFEQTFGTDLNTKQSTTSAAGNTLGMILRVKDM